MKKTVKIVLLWMVVCTTACKKDDKKDSATDPTNQQNNTTTDGSYVKATINGTAMTADFTTPNSAVVSNSYDKDDDEAQFIRFKESTAERWNFYFDDIDFDTISYPRILKDGGPSGQPQVEVWYNNGNEGAIGNFISDSGNPELFTVTLTSWSNNVLQGTFSGTLESGYYLDSLITITDGEFKITMMTY